MKKIIISVALLLVCMQGFSQVIFFNNSDYQLEINYKRCDWVRKTIGVCTDINTTPQIKENSAYSLPLDITYNSPLFVTTIKVYLKDGTPLFTKIFPVDNTFYTDCQTGGSHAGLLFNVYPNQQEVSCVDAGMGIKTASLKSHLR